jgi:predicted site-specific integrase-resolvase
MTAEEPKISPNAKYSCTQAAKLLGVDIKTLYRWRKNGLVKEGIRRCNGLPFIKGSEIKRIWDATY